MAVLLAGLPTTIPGATVNRLCGSGLEAVIAASPRGSSVGDADVVIAGGVESMSRAPWVLQKPAKGYPTWHEQLWSTTLGWRMTNPKMPDAWTVPLGEGAELLADKYSISREEQDVFAHGSHQRADVAWTAGHFAAEIVPRRPPGLEREPAHPADTTIEKLAGLRTVFWCLPDGGTVTAGNASPMNDGSAAPARPRRTPVWRAPVGSRSRASRAVATSGVEPHLYGIGPVEAARTALRRAGIDWGDLSSVELNEAFAAQSLACLREWPELDPSIVNPLGGAIAIGHPLGCVRCPHPRHARAPSRPHRRPVWHGGDVHRRRPGHRRRRREPALIRTLRVRRARGRCDGGRA